MYSSIALNYYKIFIGVQNVYIPTRGHTTIIELSQYYLRIACKNLYLMLPRSGPIIHCCKSLDTHLICISKLRND